MINFEWDEQKNKSNRQKHSVWFEEAVQIFNDPHIRFFADNEHSSEEDRFVAVGFSGSARLLVVVHCFRDQNRIVRIISARKATKRERLFYEKRI